MLFDLTNVNWFKQKPKKMFHGVDLNKWYYLGQSEISITTTKENKPLYTDYNNVYFFVSQEDSPNEKRKIVLNIDEERWREHRFVVDCEIWEMGEGSVYEMIVTAPSDWVKEEMLKQHNRVWDYETKKWIPAKDKETDENPQESS